ncbi:hypothetical protein [Pseudomonas sp. CGJS7]|uniref:hypothetical protein n=1 Tax=Pseudomonas sp. CGJS7 TaxID=3109348 RepID=UPI00300930B8
MTTARKRVADAALKIVTANPTGIRWADLARAVAAALPDENRNTITGSLHTFRNNLPPGITRPDRGVYALGDSASHEPAPASVSTATKHRESAFYKPFALWLENDLEEVTVAKPIGGNGAGGKWGTPDVIGLYEARPSDPIKFPTEVLAVEIKIDTQSLITAFGQACAYKLFAHRVYIAVPRNSNQSDLKRLDALASVVGIGLVKFNAEDPENPDFQVMVRAAKHEPDYYYTNELLSNYKRMFGL